MHKKAGFRLVRHYRAVNKEVKKVLSVMPNHEADLVNVLGSSCFGKADMLQGYWQMLLAADAQNVFTITTPDGLFTPTRVPQELNASGYFQGTMTELLARLPRKVWVWPLRVGCK